MTPDALLSVLPEGPESGTSVSQLVAFFGVNERVIRAGLEALSGAGYPVVTVPTPGGKSVYLARTPEEMEAGIRHLKAKRDSTSARITRMRRTQKKWMAKRQKQLRLVV